MTESLTVPTATTFRVVPVGTLEQKRKLLNQGFQGTGKSGKISFTHFIAFALVQGTKQHPVMGHTLVVRTTADRVAPEGIGLGLAVDVQRQNGSRGLVVPVIKRAEAWTTRSSTRRTRLVVERARGNRLMPFATIFAGGTMTLTNPAVWGPWLGAATMAGQGPSSPSAPSGIPRSSPACPRSGTRAQLSKVMTIT